MYGLPLVLGGLVAFWFARTCLRWQRSITQAKAIGLPYVIAPFFLPWHLQHIPEAILGPLIRCLPKRYWQHWLGKLTADVTIHARHEWFDELGHDAVVVASPRGLELFTCNAEVMHQALTKPVQFPKELKKYAMLSQFGKSVITTEGAEWRVHRRATAPSFSEKNAGLVFYEAVRRAESMLAEWADKPVIKTLEEDTMRFALSVITYVGFGIRFWWPGEKRPEAAMEGLAKYGAPEPCKGHKMSFYKSLEALMDGIILLMVTPRWLLPLLPFGATRRALQGHDEAFRYMNELLDERIQRISTGAPPDDGMNLMGHLAETSFTRSGPKRGGEGVIGREGILANAFIMFLAGHETTARTLQITLILLAMNPSSQRRLQQDVDALVGTRDPSGWNYEGLITPMTASMLSACMHETLRLHSPAVNIPKKAAGPGGQVIVREGVEYLLPEDCLVTAIVPASHTDVRYWPTERSKRRPGCDDMLDYVPERWFRKMALPVASSSADAASAREREKEEEELEGFAGRKLFKPERGAYLPFSDGARSCLGKRIAEVEIIAGLAVIFQRYSVELAVDEYLQDGDAPVEKMGREERREVYERARDGAQRVLGTARLRVTPKLFGDVPVRLVRRGEEQFASWL